MENQKGENKINANPFPKMEEAVLDFWDKARIFEKSVENPPLPPLVKGGKKRDYVFYDGPPFGTGEPHYGHLLSSISKDVVPRFWTMRGYRVERRWGWDCHGLPIENIIEQDLKISGKKQIEKIGVAKFCETCRARVLEYADIWEVMIRRIGRWIEFKNSYKTMDLSYMESVWWAFKELWKKGLIYQGRKVQLYCPRCETPISNFEVAMDNSYKDITEESVIVKFKIASPLTPLLIRRGVGAERQGEVYLLAWTTTPWTLPGNVALAVGEKIDYVLVNRSTFDGYDIGRYGAAIDPKDLSKYKVRHLKSENLILAKDKIKDVFKDNNYKIIKEFKGKDLVGLKYEPLFDVPALKNSGKKVYQVYAADFVTTDEGTGIVHTAVVYGEDDYNLGLKYDLPVIPALDDKGIFNDTVPQFKGVYFKKADKMVIEDLTKRGLIFATEQTKHSYPFCHRCETQLFYNAIPAWFIAVSQLKKKMLELNEKINWFPDYLKHGRFALGIEQAPDWNISRNRYFGTPIPVWCCDKCSQLEVIGSVKELEEKSGAKNINDIHIHKVGDLFWSCSKCGGTMKRISQVLDCWVESGSMPFAQMHYPFENKEKFEKNFPAQFIAEYISQTRAWFYVMHVMSTALFNSHSFENVIATGVILTEKGEKMSKSKKNYPDPWKVINEFGVDALRFYLMSSAVMAAENLFFNERDLRDVFRKNVIVLWNVYKFYEMFAGSGIESESESKANLGESNFLDKYILVRLNGLIEEVTVNMEKYNLPRAVRLITEFIDDLSTWYISCSRGRFKSGDAVERQDALVVAKYVLIELAKVIAPFMPFIAETIWQNVMNFNFKDDNKSVHLESWPTYFAISDKDWIENKKEDHHKISRAMEYDHTLRAWEIARRLVAEGLMLRNEAGIKVRQPLSSITINELSQLEYSCTQAGDHDGFKGYFNQLKQIILDKLNVKEIKLVNNGGITEVVSIDMEVSGDLKLEGLRREIVRQVNAMRKKAGLTIKDRIILNWRSDSEMVKKVFSDLGDEIKKDVLAEKIAEGGNGEEVKVNGEGVELEVRKI